MNPKNLKIGFVGVGRMGANMARCLDEREYSISTVYDIDPVRAEVIAAELDVNYTRSLKEVAEISDVVFVVVAGNESVRDIYQNEGDNLLMAAEGVIFINCSTVSPAIHVEAERKIMEAGASTIECCLSRSVPEARKGELFLLVAGEENVYSRMKPILAEISKGKMYLGEMGAASLMKSISNMVINMNTAVLAEGLALGDALNLDLTLLREVLENTGANSKVLETDGEDMQEGRHECYFSCSDAAGVSALSLELANKHGLHLPLAEETLKRYRELVETGHGDEDKSVVAKLTFKDRTT